MDFEDLKDHYNKNQREYNRKGIVDFEGYSPSEMQIILYQPFSPISIIQFLQLEEYEYKQIPILCQIKHLAELVQSNNEIKLTSKGYLPTKIVKDIYDQGFLSEESIEKGISKLYKESDSMTVHLSRILLEISGITKKWNGKLSLTAKGAKVLSKDDELLKLIFETFATKFNWAYFDGYGENKIGQLGWGFSLILLGKYGSQKREDIFYSKKYFRAFPMLLDKLETSYGTLERYANRCYSLRTFERFLDYFGLIKIESERKGYDSIKHITKTPLFDRLVKCTPHNTMQTP